MVFRLNVMDDVGMSRNIFVKIGGRGNDIQMAFDHADGHGQNVDSLVDRSIIFNVKRMPSIKCIDRTVCVCALQSFPLPINSCHFYNFIGLFFNELSPKNPLRGVKIFCENSQIRLCCSSMYVLLMECYSKVTNKLFHELRIITNTL